MTWRARDVNISQQHHRRKKTFKIMPLAHRSSADALMALARGDGLMPENDLQADRMGFEAHRTVQKERADDSDAQLHPTISKQDGMLGGYVPLGGDNLRRRAEATVALLTPTCARTGGA